MKSDLNILPLPRGDIRGVIPVFEQLVRLFEMALLIEEKESADSTRFETALKYFARTFDRSMQTRNPLKNQEVKELIGWEY